MANELPFNRDAEEALIAAAVTSPSVLASTSTIVGPQDFYIVRNGWIWECLVAMHRAGKAIDFITLSEEMARRGYLKDAGGETYIAGMLMSDGFFTYAAEEYAKAIKLSSIRRGMVTAASKIAAAAYNAEMDEAALLAVTEEQARSIRTSVPTTSTRNAQELITSAYESAMLSSQHKTPPTIPTGFYDLDRFYLKGLRNGRVYIVATRPGVGKSAFLLDIARHAAISRGRRVLINSLEMSGEEVVGRIIAGQYEIVSENIEMGTLTPEEWEKMNAGLQASERWTFSVDDTPGITIEAIAAKAETLALQSGLDLLMIDYVQLVKCQSGWGDSRLRNRQQEVGHVSRTMKEIARKLNIPVVAAAQVNRMSESRADYRIRIADLREAGDLEQDADCVILIQPPGDEQPKERPIIEFEVAKHRGGRTGSTDLLFVPSLPSFRNVAAGKETSDWWR